MPARQIVIDGRTWRVYPGGFLTASSADEFSLLFVAGSGNATEVRLTRFSPIATRAREQAVADLDDRAIRRLFLMSQPSARAPETGYRA